MSLTVMRRSGRSFREVLYDFLRAGLSALPGAKRRTRFTVKPKALQARPGISYDNIEELLEKIEGPHPH